ncbi:disulfide bond formation protein B [Thalassospira sp.]|uniref:disulfide bond formation protein B n=1 Tax=Thalassospira sp. TaxID=1912094 RepID=UPI002734E524|nr:disulfide bond formation protein B [Thalassospira sp.]MDP2696557.1 disulfide bond formation protein B [Thalassospira sp.]
MLATFFRRRYLPALPPIAILLASASSIGFAFYAQYVQKLMPCVLCLYQRVPFYAAGGIAIIALLVLRIPGAARMLVYLCGALFLAGAVIAFYHVGVQYLWWEGPAMCGGVASGATSIETLQAQLMAQPIIRCDKIDWALFGVTMPMINVGFSLLLATLCFIAPNRWMQTPATVSRHF